MTIEVQDLTELDNQDVQDTAELLGDLLATRLPDVDATRGALRRLVLHPAAVLSAKSRLELDRLRRSLSIATAVEDPELADAELLNAAASNFRIDRYPGSAASGSIVIVVSRQDPLLIPAGFAMLARGVRYSTDRALSVRSDPAGVVGDDDRVLNPTDDDQWSFSIPVTAEEIGAAGRLLRGESASPVVPPSNFVKAYAASDFTGGVDQETNSALLGRVRAGVACRSMSDRISMSASLLAEKPEVVTHSIIGAGDPEMGRDQHGIFPGSVGGCVDWYVRTSQLPIRRLLQKTATLVEVENSGYGIWQFGLSRNDSPGFYEVRQILQAGGTSSGGYEVVRDLRGLDTTPLDDARQEIPDLITAAEAAYSRFQTAVIRFRDTDTPTVGLVAGSSTREYDVVVSGFPEIAEIQEIFGARDRTGTAGDMLVRSPIPAWLSLSIEIRIPVEAEDVDEDALRNDVLVAVNSTPIGSELAGSVVLDVVHRHLPTGSFVRSLDMLCRIRTPSGSNIWMRGSDVIEIPDRPADQVTPRTTVFILEPEQVVVSVQTLQRSIV